jgi:16S rRNA (uracil1498-N3)-methyltransferase
MHRFHCPHLISPVPPDCSQPGPVELSDPLIVLDPEESHHAARVLRLEAGEKVGLFNGQGLKVEGVIQNASKTQMVVKAESATWEPAAKPEIWVAAAVAKGSRPDDMVDQLSQVNATGWIPLITRRSVVDPRASKVEKLRKVAIASAKQCGRAHLMQITDPRPFSDVFSDAADVRLLANADGQPYPGITLGRSMVDAKKVILFIGPEGGWTDEEIQQATTAGCSLWKLGEAIMRVETAAVVAASVARYLVKMNS